MVLPSWLRDLKLCSADALVKVQLLTRDSRLGTPESQSSNLKQAHISEDLQGERHEIHVPWQRQCRVSVACAYWQSQQQSVASMTYNLRHLCCFLALSTSWIRSLVQAQCTLGGSTEFCGYKADGAISGGFNSPCSCQRTLCCSAQGYCGPEQTITSDPASAYCGAGCQSAYGNCNPGTSCPVRFCTNTTLVMRGRR